MRSPIEAEGLFDTSEMVPAWAIDVLRDQRMPSAEIDSIMRADDLELIRRYFELHRERLEERLADQQGMLASVEQLFASQWIDGSMPVGGPALPG